MHQHGSSKNYPHGSFVQKDALVSSSILMQQHVLACKVPAETETASEADRDFMNQKRKILATCMLFASTSCFASDKTNEFEPYIYAGAAPLIWMYANDTVEGMAVGTGFQGRLGAQLTESIGLEGRYGTGGDGDLSGVNVSLDGQGSLLLTLSSELGGNHRAGAYGGFTSGTMTYSYNGYTAQSSDSGVSFGAFVNLSLTDSVYTFIDYGTYIWKSDYIVQGVSIGLGVSF